MTKVTYTTAAALAATLRRAYRSPGSGITVESMNVPVDPSRFEEMYRDEQTAHGLPTATPWDIGGPQPVIRQLVALGAVKGEVLDPGTGPGHHAIHYASKGYSATGIDASPTAIQRARDNAEAAGVSVNFQVADATVLEGLENRFDTVVDSAFYHTFSTDTDLQKSYLRALHRATKPGARLFMFEFSPHNVNGLSFPLAIPEDNFRQVLPAGGWNLTYLGPTTYQGNLSVDALEAMAAGNPDMSDEFEPLLERLRIIEPLLIDGRAHLPFWEVHATRID
ncbi:class I SAM-dependent methyltransferase [Prescottella soli]